MGEEGNRENEKQEKKTIVQSKGDWNELVNLIKTKTKTGKYQEKKTKRPHPASSVCIWTLRRMRNVNEVWTGIWAFVRGNRHIGEDRGGMACGRGTERAERQQSRKPRSPNNLVSARDSSKRLPPSAFFPLSSAFEKSIKKEETEPEVNTCPLYAGGGELGKGEVKRLIKDAAGRDENWYNRR